MLKKACLSLSLLLLLAAKNSSQDYKVSNGFIAFRSDAAMELIKAESTELKGIIAPAKKQFAFIVEVNTFKGFNSPLQQEHFNENYLESKKFRNASFDGKIIEDVDFSKDGTFEIRAKGNLSIHGVAQERIIKSQITIKGKKVSLKSNFTVLLADHNIPIPKVVYEKLASEIKVEVKAALDIK